MGEPKLKNRIPKSSILLFATVGWFFLTFWPFPTVAQVFKRASEIEGRLIPITGDESVRTVDLDIQFGLNMAKLTDEARHQLAELGQALNSDRLVGARFEINGHTDASGKAGNNKALSLKRAKAVRDFLVKSLAVNAKRLVVHGYGEERLKNSIAPNAAENRRVEIIARYVRRKPTVQNEEKKNEGGRQAIQ
jgi:outer membrane protein OmpA-like peptidoglycan-associated protein